MMNSTPRTTPHISPTLATQPSAIRTTVIHTVKGGCMQQLKTALAPGTWLTLRELQITLRHEFTTAEIQAALAKLKKAGKIEARTTENPLKLGRRVVAAYRRVGVAGISGVDALQAAGDR